MRLRSMFITAGVILAILPKVYSQTNNNRNKINRPKGIVGATFFLDKYQDCSNAEYIVEGTVVIQGPSGVTGSTTPLSCTITLVSQQQRAKIFQISVQVVKLQCSMMFYIFDGGELQTRLKSYNCYSEHSSKDEFFTTGNKVAFRLTRPSQDFSEYTIRISVTPIDDPSSGGGGGGVNPRLDRDSDYIRKFSTDTIIILISTAYLLALAICGIVLFMRYRRNKGQDEKWVKRPMGYDNNGLATPTSLGTSARDLKMYPSDATKAYPLVNKGNGKQAYPYRTRMAQSSEDADSVFEAMQMNMKSNLNHGRSTQPTSYSNEAFQRTPQAGRTRLSQKSTLPVRSRKRPEDTAVASTMQQSSPVPVKKVSVSQEVQTEIKNDENQVEYATIGLNTDPEMTDHGIQCEPDVEPDDTIDLMSIEVKKLEQASQHIKNRYRPPSYTEATSDDDHPQHYRHSPAMQQQQQQQQQEPHRHRHRQQEPYIPYSDPALRRPKAVRPHPEHIQQRADHYFSRSPQPTASLDLEPRDIPVYSYLVNRGYNPQEPSGYTPDTSASGTSHQSDPRMLQTDESDFSANLDSGVELMRR